MLGRDVNYQALCSANADSGSSCSDMCICANCAPQAVACFGDSKVQKPRRLRQQNSCNDPDILKANGVRPDEVPTELGAAGSVGSARGNWVGHVREHSDVRREMQR